MTIQNIKSRLSGIESHLNTGRDEPAVIAAAVRDLVRCVADLAKETERLERKG